MCGSLLSKFKSENNKIDSAVMTLPETRRFANKMTLANQDAACFEDREFWKDEDKQSQSSFHYFAVVWSKNLLSDDNSSESGDFSQQEAARHALANERVSLPPVRSNKNNRLCGEDRNRRLMDTAFEILAFQSSSSYTVSAVQPLSSTDSTLSQKVQTSVAFYIPFEDKKTVCLSARLPRRLRKGKVAPERTVEDVKKKMRAAEETEGITAHPRVRAQQGSGEESDTE